MEGCFSAGLASNHSLQMKETASISAGVMSDGLRLTAVAISSAGEYAEYERPLPDISTSERSRSSCNCAFVGFRAVCFSSKDDRSRGDSDRCVMCSKTSDGEGFRAGFARLPRMERRYARYTISILSSSASSLLFCLSFWQFFPSPSARAPIPG